MLRERVRTTGVYELRATVSTRTRAAAMVTLRVGSHARRARTGRHSHRAHVRMRLTLRRRVFTITASARRRPRLEVRLVRLAPLGTGTGIRGTGGPSTPHTRANSGTGATGATGATGTGTSGDPSTSASTPAPPPPSPPPLTPSVGPGGEPVLALPPGFSAVTDYSDPVEDYEFGGSSLPAGWSAGVWNYGYSATQFQPSQVSLTGSSVALTAVNQTSPEGYPYTSGWISTEGSFSLTHGLIDFRAKMPAGQGLWSGLWLDQPNGSNPWGEIDVQEMLLGDTHTVYGSLHGWAPTPTWGETQATRISADASQGFHDYEIVWQPGMITWAVDGIAYAQYTQAQAQAAGHPWPFDNSNGLYLVADLAVAGQSDWGGPPNTSTTFPATMQIQSVKVWQ
jgi:Glycosyl hydrolases family 16